MLKSFTSLIIRLAESGWLPDTVLRAAIRHLLRKRIQQSSPTTRTLENATRNFSKKMRARPLLEAAAEANDQHYEVPAEFFQRVLGKHMKYSCGLWESKATTLDQSEEAMLELTCERAEIEDGMKILELGCGWGSLSLWMAQKYPHSQIVAVSNSHSQRKFIEVQCRNRGLTNLHVITCNVADFVTPDKFDRIVSIEMFEHFRNHAQLMEKIAEWLAPEGKLFVHVFCHRDTPYRI